jgi:hypothetical protein
VEGEGEGEGEDRRCLRRGKERLAMGSGRV